MRVLLAAAQVHEQGRAPAVFERGGRDGLLYLIPDLVGGRLVRSALGVAASLDQRDVQMRQKRQPDFSVVILPHGRSQKEGSQGE